MTSMREALDEHVGPAGRLLSGGKRAPEGEEVYWNACGFTEGGEQVWWGDFNLTRDSDGAQAAADACGQAVVITPEQPFRFSGLNGEMKGMRSMYPEDRERIRRFEPKVVA